jgi:hypothetical protein
VSDKLKETLNKLVAGEFGIVPTRLFPEFRPEGPTCNSHARKGMDQKHVKTKSAEGAAQKQ